MVAKIADMGNSRIVNVQPGQLAKTMTRVVPGTIVYMPPEAFELPPEYGPKLDMFSFGHLALFTATQQFPGDLLPSTYQDEYTGRLTPRNEIQRRSKYMDNLGAMFGRSHELVQLITQCLDYSPNRRPTASEAMERLQHISSHIEDAYHNMTRLELEKRVKQLEARLEQIQVSECVFKIEYWDTELGIHKQTILSQIITSPILPVNVVYIDKGHAIHIHYNML